MKTLISKSLLHSALALFGIFGLASCIEESTVVKIHKDGSGIIHTRKYENTAAGAGLLGGLGGDADAAGEEEEIDAPTEEEFKAKAGAMGEGVTFKSLRKGKNKSGWTGYEAIYAFKDINQVKLDLNMKDADDLKQPEDDPDAPAKQGGEATELVTFEMKDGVLKIRTPDPADRKPGDGEDEEGKDEAAEGARDPFGDGPGNVRMMGMMAAMFAGAKVGFFVEIDGGIAKTNAKHQDGDMITIMRADLGKLFANPEALDKMEGLEGSSRGEVQKIVDSIDGIDMDLQDPITVEFK
jgi:hypothetical protein